MDKDAALEPGLSEYQPASSMDEAEDEEAEADERPFFMKSAPERAADWLVRKYEETFDEEVPLPPRARRRRLGSSSATARGRGRSDGSRSRARPWW